MVRTQPQNPMNTNKEAMAALLREIAEDCQAKRRCPTVDALLPWLRHYTYYLDAIEPLSEEEIWAAVNDGMMTADLAAEEEEA